MRLIGGSCQLGIREPIKRLSGHPLAEGFALPLCLSEHSLELHEVRLTLISTHIGGR
jgi:hypothetical protein